MGAMRLVTWNVNSMKARADRVLEWMVDIEPDVVCFQETKMEQDAFPTMDFAAIGYETAHFGQGRWNGVAIASRVGLDDVVENFAAGVEPDHEARIISATCAGVRVSSVYVPNGRALDDDHYQYKLGWLDRLVEHLEVSASRDQPVVVAGDYNIAPTDDDVFDPAEMLGSTHVSDAERDRLAALERWGLVDLFRRRYPDAAGVYSWWDYRNGDFHKGRGLRIDLVLGTEAVAAATTWAIVDRNARKGKQPSDHAPVIAEFEL